MGLLIDALHCRNRGRPPIWLMRQAGRYLPEYRRLKGSRPLYDLFHDVEKIVEITKLPVDLLGVDGAILFSDILTVLDGLSVGYVFKEGVGPVVETPVDQMCPRPPEEAYPHIVEAIHILNRELSVPLLGFAGAPYTIAHYLYHGKAKETLFQNRKAFEEVLEKITEATISYVQAQQKAGVAAIQLFDSWANQLPLAEFRDYSLRPMQQILQTLEIPVILFCRGSCFFVEELVEINPAAISLDWSGDLLACSKKIPQGIAVQGNLDPMVLYGSQKEIEQRVAPLLEAMEGHPGYIFNLGHGLLPDIPVENVKFLVDYVQSRSRAFAQTQ